MAILAAAEWPYIWRWRKTAWCPQDYPLARYAGQPCRVLVRGGRNACLVEFPDGQRAITSRWGVQRRKACAALPAAITADKAEGGQCNQLC
jgi:hypothetical protein